MRYLTADEVATLADTIDERYRAFVLVGAYCGLRWGELAGLRRHRVDLMHRSIQVVEALGIGEDRRLALLPVKRAPVIGRSRSRRWWPTPSTII